ncbi:MAG: hypothetical protein KID04_14505 [Clostridium sp.]|nr:hypothetical protein [Clostridium sp.]DAI95671.1 MAG TPA: hypothetical protein [Caudoviricetes sp.]
MGKYIGSYKVKFIKKKIKKEYGRDVFIKDQKVSYVSLSYTMDRIFNNIRNTDLLRMKIEWQQYLKETEEKAVDTTPQLALAISIFSFAMSTATNILPEAKKMEAAVYILYSSAFILFLIAITNIIILIMKVSTSRKTKYIRFKLNCLNQYLRVKQKYAMSILRK